MNPVGIQNSRATARFIKFFAALAFLVMGFGTSDAVAQVSYIKLVGTSGYQFHGDGTVTLTIPEIHNTSSTYKTGTLRVELWASTSPYYGGQLSGYKMAQVQFGGSSNGQLEPNHYFSAFDYTTSVLVTPPNGSYAVTLTVDEYSSSGCTSADGFCIDAWASFSNPLIIGASAPSCTIAVTPSSLPSTGGMVTARANCTGSPTSFRWSDSLNAPGITSLNSNAITVTYTQNSSPSPVTDILTVVATNSAGSSSPAHASVTIAAASSSHGFSIGSGITGSWYNQSQSGHGFQLEVLDTNPPQLLAYWFVYGPSGYGGQAWVGGIGPIAGNQATLQAFWLQGPGGVFPPYFNAHQVTEQSWGTLTFTFSDCNNGNVQWYSSVPGYGSGSLAISRLTLPAGLSCP